MHFTSTSESLKTLVAGLALPTHTLTPPTLPRLVLLNEFSSIVDMHQPHSTERGVWFTLIRLPSCRRGTFYPGYDIATRTGYDIAVVLCLAHRWAAHSARARRFRPLLRTPRYGTGNHVAAPALCFWMQICLYVLGVAGACFREAQSSLPRISKKKKRTILSL